MKKNIHLLMSVLAFFVFCGVVSANEIDDLLNKAKREGKPVMLEVGSDACLPCIQMQPVMKRLEDEYKDKMFVIYADATKYRDISRKFHILGLPTQIFLDKKGNEFHRHIGFYSYKEIKDLLKKIDL